MHCPPLILAVILGNILENAFRDASEKAILPVAFEFFGYMICKP
jgi:TctA family transporter